MLGTRSGADLQLPPARSLSVADRLTAQTDGTERSSFEMEVGLLPPCLFAERIPLTHCTMRNAMANLNLGCAAFGMRDADGRAPALW